MTYTNKQHNTLKKLINESINNRIKDKLSNLREDDQRPGIAPMVPNTPGGGYNPGLPFHPVFNPIPGIQQKPGVAFPTIPPTRIKRPFTPSNITFPIPDPGMWWYHPWGFPAWPIHQAPPNVR